MREITISTAQTRRAFVWNIEKLEWADLAARLSTTFRTGETEYDYHNNFDKEAQGRAKDIGGFVGGELKEGRRKKGYVKYRDLLTLDLDDATSEFIDQYKTNWKGFASLIYSTHSHTHSAPRLRFIAPLSRSVDPTEYEALGRRVAEMIDKSMLMFDDSTYQAERMMYWPSTPSDGEYIYVCHDGAWLDVDKILSTYIAPNDPEEWPRSEREKGSGKTLHKNSGKLNDDPRKKRGLIGAFCRAYYPIQTAIEKFLGDVYKPEPGGRYTYIKGQTKSGVVVYSDLWVFSNHGTDPACGIECNAFDIVRVHLFGGLDASISPQTPVCRRPSYDSMCRLAGADERVRAELPAVLSVKDEADDGAWASGLSYGKNNKVESTFANILLILKNLSGLKNNIYWNEFNDKIEIRSDLPWREVRKENQYWSDRDNACLAGLLETKFGIVSKEKMLNALAQIQLENKYHPLREKLDSLPEWDGEKRLEKVFTTYLGARPSALTAAIARKSFAAAIARIYEPGKKFDYMTILQGPEGIGKSTFLQKISLGYFSDSLTSLSGDKGTMEQLQGHWILEISELSAMRKSDLEEQKRFISKTADSYRAAYARESTTRLRQCVFFASTNETDFYKGDTGNRRYWLVVCDKGAQVKPWEMKESEILQLWAEAKKVYLSGEQLCLDAAESEQLKMLQQNYDETESHPWTDIICSWLDARPYIDRVCPAMLYKNAICGTDHSEGYDWKRNFKVKDSKLITKILRLQKGWKQLGGTQRVDGFGKMRNVFERISDGNPSNIVDFETSKLSKYDTRF